MALIRHSEPRWIGSTKPFASEPRPSAPVSGTATEDVNACTGVASVGVTAPAGALCDIAWPPLTAAALAADPLADRHECVYIVLAREQRLVKIGWTRNPPERLRQLRRWSPVSLEWSVALAGGRDLERELHRLFGGDRAHGEWFRISPNLARLVLSALLLLQPHLEAAA